MAALEDPGAVEGLVTALAPPRTAVTVGERPAREGAERTATPTARQARPGAAASAAPPGLRPAPRPIRPMETLPPIKPSCASCRAPVPAYSRPCVLRNQSGFSKKRPPLSVRP